MKEMGLREDSQVSKFPRLAYCPGLLFGPSAISNVLHGSMIYTPNILMLRVCALRLSALVISLLIVNRQISDGLKNFRLPQQIPK